MPLDSGVGMQVTGTESSSNDRSRTGNLWSKFDVLMNMEFLWFADFFFFIQDFTDHVFSGIVINFIIFGKCIEKWTYEKKEVIMKMVEK